MPTNVWNALHLVDPCIGAVFREVSPWHVVRSHILGVSQRASDDGQCECKTNICDQVSEFSRHRTLPFSTLLDWFASASRLSLSLEWDTALRSRFHLRIPQWCGHSRTFPSSRHSG